MKTTPGKTRITSLAALLMFAVFAVCVLFVLLTGAQVYQRLTQREQVSFEKRTAVQYITTRLRQGDIAGAVAVERFGQGDALVLTEEVGGTVYETRIYCWDGWLRELYAEAGAGLEPEDGERILEAEGFYAAPGDTEKNSLLIYIDIPSGRQEMILHMRSGEEVCL